MTRRNLEKKEKYKKHAGNAETVPEGKTVGIGRVNSTADGHVG